MSYVIADVSLGGTKSNSLNNAVNSLVQQGIIVTVSAGNDGDDACLKSPASASYAITVAAIDENDSRPSYSNYGPCIDIFA